MSVRTQIERLNSIKERMRVNLAAQGIPVPEGTMLDAMAEMVLSVAGEDGITPHIGENGNWYLGTEDTGVAAQGEPGGEYVLTDGDKEEIAATAASLLDVSGKENTSNKVSTILSTANADQYPTVQAVLAYLASKGQDFVFTLENETEVTMKLVVL